MCVSVCVRGGEGVACLAWGEHGCISREGALVTNCCWRWPLATARCCCLLPLPLHSPRAAHMPSPFCPPHPQGMVSSRIGADLPALPAQSRLAPEDFTLLPPLRSGEDVWEYVGRPKGTKPAFTGGPGGGSALLGDYQPPPPIEKRAPPAAAAPAPTPAAAAPSKPAPAAAKCVA